jgi:dTDP-glucose 4,6-dehydratase
MNNKKILITGGAGFFGAHFVEHILKNTDWNIAIIDKLSYASLGLSRLKEC